LRLPVTVVKGSVRRIHVVVPWNQLGSASVQITIEGVYALVTPNTTLPSVEEMRQFKRNQIERLELLRQHDRLAATHNREGEDEGTFLSRLTARIVDTCRSHCATCTFEGNETFVDRAARRERFLHKAVKVACAGVYWDRLARDDSRALLQTRPGYRRGDGRDGTCHE
ncbi:hypothetical protein PINS_up023439, partial [Pythium insidiosum]